MMKIVLFADSLSLPRPVDVGDIPYEETYPYLIDCSLRNKFGKNSPIIIQRGKRARTIKDVVCDWDECVKLIKPDIVIIHVGIVDCAPRVFLPKQQAFVEKLKPEFVKKYVLNFVKNNRRNIIKAFPNRVYTPINIFKKHIKYIIENSIKDGVRKLIFVNIIIPPDYVEHRSPGFQKNVIDYNSALVNECSGVVDIIDINKVFHDREDIDKYLLTDGYHLSIEGNRLTAKKLEQYLLESDLFTAL